jgi:hypothetical protein
MDDKPFEAMGYFILFGIIVCFGYWPVGLTIIGLALLGIIFIAFDREWILARHRRAAWAADLAEKADRQHAAALRGDPYGLYGEYPPAI